MTLEQLCRFPGKEKKIVLGSFLQDLEYFLIQNVCYVLIKLGPSLNRNLHYGYVTGPGGGAVMSPLM